MILTFLHYLRYVLSWGALGAFFAWGLMTGALLLVSHTDGIPYSAFSWDPFLTFMCMGGFLFGAITGIDEGHRMLMGCSHG